MGLRRRRSHVLTVYQRRMLLAGLAVLAMAVLAGIFLSFSQWDRGSPFDRSSWNYYNPLGRATIGPLAFAFMIFPITLPVVFILAIPIYLGLKKPSLWPLALLGYLSLGLLWVWFVTELWKID